MMLTVRVIEQKFDSSAELAQFRDSHSPGSVGAIVSFSGTVRDLTGSLESLTLEHYPAMTKKALEDIGYSAMERFSLHAALIVHRYGKMAPGEDIVFVAASSAHRESAFDGTRFMMDFLKNDAPFWKRETLKSGDSQWVAAQEKDIKAQKSWQD